MPPLPVALTHLPGRLWRLFERSTTPRLLCHYTGDISLLALHGAVHFLGDISSQTRVQVCNTWWWLALEGELYAVSNLQTTLTTHGVLLTATADTSRAAGVQIITHCLVGVAQCLPLSVFVSNGRHQYSGTTRTVESFLPADLWHLV